MTLRKLLFYSCCADFSPFCLLTIQIRSFIWKTTELLLQQRHYQMLKKKALGLGGFELGASLNVSKTSKLASESIFELHEASFLAFHAKAPVFYHAVLITIAIQTWAKNLLFSFNQCRKMIYEEKMSCETENAAWNKNSFRVLPRKRSTHRCTFSQFKKMLYPVNAFECSFSLL